MNKWTTIPTDEEIEKVIAALKERNINAEVVNTGKEAKEKILSLLPNGSRVLVSASVSAEEIGLKDEIENSNNLVSVRKEYMALDRATDAVKIRKLRGAPEIIIGSVHAVTKNGEVLIASNTGSQLAPYVYSAQKVIWVVGAQKIVENIEEGMKRINEYIVPLEEKHMQSLYGVSTNVSKILIFNKEVAKERVTLIFVKEVLGY